MTTSWLLFVSPPMPQARVFPTASWAPNQLQAWENWSQKCPLQGTGKGGTGSGGGGGGVCPPARARGRRGRPLPAAPTHVHPSPRSPTLRPARSARSQWGREGRGPVSARANESAGPRGGAWPGAHHAGAVGGADYFFRGRGGLSPARAPAAAASAPRWAPPLP